MGTFNTSNPTTREIGISGGVVTYEDMLGDISSARLPASNTPVWTDITLDGFTVKALAFDTDDYVDIFVQTQHSGKLSQLIENHIHWTIATDDDGDRFAFQVTGVAAGIGASFASIGTILSADVILAGNAGKHNYLEIGDLPAVNTTISTVFIIRLTRVAPAAGSDTTENIYVLFNDSHLQIDTLGSLQEGSKV